MFSKVCDFLEIYLLRSLLEKTTPITRIFFCLLICMALFVNGVLTLAVISAVVLMFSLADPETLLRHLYLIVVTIVLTLILLIVETVFPQSLSSFMGWSGASGQISILKMAWKVLIVIFGAVVFVILVPQNHIVYALRRSKIPQLWVAVIAAFRATEIGYFALTTVRKTQISKHIKLWPPRTAAYFVDSFVTGVFGHLFHIVDEFELAIRSKGVESSLYTPADEIPRFGYCDLALLGAMVALVFAAVRGV